MIIGSMGREIKLLIAYLKGKVCIALWLIDDVVIPWAFGGTRIARDHSLTHPLTRFSLIYSLKSD